MITRDLPSPIRILYFCACVSLRICYRLLGFPLFTCVLKFTLSVSDGLTARRVAKPRQRGLSIAGRATTAYAASIDVAALAGNTGEVVLQAKGNCFRSRGRQSRYINRSGMFKQATQQGSLS